jgi:hypothetical protein
MRQNSTAIPALLLGLLLTISLAQAGDKAGEQINWQVISSGGGDGSSANYQLSGTVGQTAVGTGSSASYGLGHGFWQDFGAGGGPCDCMPGDANNTGTHNILDCTYLISYLYKGGPAPVPYEVCSGDANKTCGINILDVTYLINYLYKGGPPPCSCEEWVAACGQP